MSTPCVAPTPDGQLSKILIKLLRGFIYREESRHWDLLLMHQDSVRQYFAPLRLKLFLEEADGYAFLRSISASLDNEGSDNPEEADESGDVDGSLIRKIPLSFDVTLLCVLLREALEQFDSSVSDDHRLILGRDEIHDLMREFFPERTDDTKYVRRLDALIAKVEELGFLRALSSNSSKFEVRRPIKALIDAVKLSAIKQQLLAHVGSGGTTDSGVQEGVHYDS